MNNSDVKFVFFGSAEICIFTLEKMKKSEILPSVIVTLPAAPFGRGRRLKDNPIKTWADENGIPAILWRNSEQTKNDLLALHQDFDFALVFAFGKILKKDFLELSFFKHGFLNIHPSLLPKLRGPSPIRSTLLKNERENVGITIIKMDEKMDHGPIVLQKQTELKDWPLPGRELDEILALDAGELIAQNIEKIKNGNLNEKEQNHEKASFTTFFKKEDCKLNTESIKEDGEIAGKDKFTACACDKNPSPFFFIEKGGKKLRVKISKLKSENGKIFIEKLIPEGKKELAWQDFPWRLNLPAREP